MYDCAYISHTISHTYTYNIAGRYVCDTYTKHTRYCVCLTYTIHTRNIHKMCTCIVHTFHTRNIRIHDAQTYEELHWVCAVHVCVSYVKHTGVSCPKHTGDTYTNVYTKRMKIYSYKSAYTHTHAVLLSNDCECADIHTDIRGRFTHTYADTYAQTYPQNFTHFHTV